MDNKLPTGLGQPRNAPDHRSHKQAAACICWCIFSDFYEQQRQWICTLNFLLFCLDNGVHFNLSNNPQLHSLFCDGNQLTELNISQNPNLGTLWCQYNNIQELSLDTPSLQSLSCEGNALTHLVLNTPNLLDLYCNDNQLTSLDLADCPKLWELDCSNNQITELFVSPEADFRDLFCQNNQLTDIKSLVSNPLIGRDPHKYIDIDIRYNNLNNGDWEDVMNLKERISGQETFLYSPQNGLDPYDGLNPVESWNLY